MPKVIYSLREIVSLIADIEESDTDMVTIKKVSIQNEICMMFDKSSSRILTDPFLEVDVSYNDFLGHKNTTTKKA